MSKAISILSRSRRVYCFGQGGSMVMAMEAWSRFSTAAPNFIHICDSHMQLQINCYSLFEGILRYQNVVE